MIKKIRFLAVTALLCVGFAAQSNAAAGPIEITYYYYSPCEGCPEGEALGLQLEHTLSTVASPHEYRLTVKNIFEEKALIEFRSLTDSMLRDGFVPDAPMVRINGAFLFGIDDITNKTAGAVAAIKAGRGDIGSVLSSMSGVEEKMPYFVYFYLPDCEGCKTAAAFFENLQTETVYRIDRIDISEKQLIPLVHCFFDAYHVPKERRKLPIVFYQGGFLQGAEEIAAQMRAVIESGQALGWEGIEYQPKALTGLARTAAWLAPAAALSFLAAFLLIKRYGKRGTP